MKNNIAYLLVFMIIAFLINSCSNNHTETIIIPDVGISEKYDVRFKLKDGKYVYKIHIHAKGNIDDTVKIGNLFLLPSKVDTTFRNRDWYSSGYILDYKPYKAKSGELSILIEFVTF